MKKVFLLFVSTFLLSCSMLLTSCKTEVNNTQIISMKKETNRVNAVKNNISFSIKVNNSLITYVKSLNAYISKSSSDPFNNVYLDGSFFTSDIVNNTVSFVFKNVPVGGPYYVYLSAYDDISTSLTKKNITAINNSLTSVDKKWSPSLNNVTVTNSGALVFSDANTSVKVSLKVLLNTTGITINPINGSNTPTNAITVIKN